jgi:hypothetical protein
MILINYFGSRLSNLKGLNFEISLEICSKYVVMSNVKISAGLASVLFAVSVRFSMDDEITLRKAVSKRNG